MEGTSDNENNNKKRPLSSEVDEANDHHGPLPNTKKQRLYDEPRRATAASEDTNFKHVKKNVVTPIAQILKSAPPQGSPMRSDTSSKVRPGGNAKVLDKHVKEYIKSELSHREGGFIPGYPVIDFVRNVWGFTPESIPRGQTGYKLDALLVYAYETSEYTKGKQYTSYERTSCAAFEDIFNGLADLVETNQKEVAPLSQSAEFNSKLYFLRERVLDGDYAGFKPDYASTKKGALDDRRKKLHWERAGIVGEQKKHVPKEMEEVPLQGEIIIDPGLLLPNEGASSVLNDVQPQHLRRVEKRSAKNRANKTDQGRSTPLQPVVIAEEKVSAPAQGVNSGEEPMLVSEAQTGQPRNVSKDGLPDGVDQIPLAEAEPVDPASWTNPSPATAEISKLEAGEPGKLRDEEVQITKYLGELLAHGIRQYASGFLVEDQWITLWYADRYGVVESVNFNWIQEPHYLLLVVAALLFASREQLGFSPFVDVDPAAPEQNPYSKAVLRVPGNEDIVAHCLEKKGGDGRKHQSDPERTDADVSNGDEEGEDSQRIGERGRKEAKGEERKLCGDAQKEEGRTKSKSCTLDSDGKEIKETLKFIFDATQHRRIVTQYGIIGRGTTVIPVKVTGSQVTAKAIGVEGEMPLVAKLAWQHVDRKEDALIRTIRKSLNIENDPQSLSMLTHIVDMKCSLSLSTDSPHLHLPRAFMNKLPSLSYEDLREFRLLILEAYEPLENLTEVEDFKKVFLETFKAHHWVWTKAEVLHRDISVNNIMFRRRNGGVEGVLCDWDLAATKAYLGEPDPDDYTRVTPQEIEARRAMRNRPLTARLAAVLNSPPGPAAQSQQPHTQASTQNGANTDGGGINQEQSQPRPRYRTGTGPFMAFELLGNPPDRTPVHRYSFDAQSFFYVLVWMAVAHNPDKHKLGRIPEWIHPKLIDTFNAKSNFLNTEVDQNVILQRVRPPYTEWVMGLYEKVADAALAFMTIRRLRSNLIGAIVENNTQRIQSIRQTLKENVQKLENAITYEGFLEVLTSE